MQTYLPNDGARLSPAAAARNCPRSSPVVPRLPRVRDVLRLGTAALRRQSILARAIWLALPATRAGSEQHTTKESK